MHGLNQHCPGAASVYLKSWICLWQLEEMSLSMSDIHGAYIVAKLWNYALRVVSALIRPIALQPVRNSIIYVFFWVVI